MKLSLDPRTLRIIMAVLLFLFAVVLALAWYERRQATARIENQIEDLKHRIEALQMQTKGGKRQPEQKK
jgi:cell division protein FtsL